VNNKIYVAGGRADFSTDNNYPSGNPAPVEVYDEETTSGLLLNKNIFPQTALMQWK